jgi:hypothetical protein
MTSLSKRDPSDKFDQQQVSSEDISAFGLRIIQDDNA